MSLNNIEMWSLCAKYLLVPHKGIPSAPGLVNREYALGNDNWLWIFDKNQADRVPTTNAKRITCIKLDETSSDKAISDRIKLIKDVMEDHREKGREKLLEAAIEKCKELKLKVNSQYPSSLLGVAKALVHGTLNGKSIKDMFKDDENSVFELHYKFAHTLCDDKEWKGKAVQHFQDLYKVRMGPKDEGDTSNSIHCLYNLLGSFATRTFKDNIRDQSRASYMKSCLSIDKPRATPNYYTSHSITFKDPTTEKTITVGSYYVFLNTPSKSQLKHYQENMILCAKADGLSLGSVLDGISGLWDSIEVATDTKKAATKSLAKKISVKDSSMEPTLDTKNIDGSLGSADLLMSAVPTLPPMDPNGAISSADSTAAATAKAPPTAAKAPPTEPSTAASTTAAKPTSRKDAALDRLASAVGNSKSSSSSDKSTLTASRKSAPSNSRTAVPPSNAATSPSLSSGAARQDKVPNVSSAKSNENTEDGGSEVAITSSRSAAPSLSSGTAGQEKVPNASSAKSNHTENGDGKVEEQDGSTDSINKEDDDVADVKTFFKALQMGKTVVANFDGTFYNGRVERIISGEYCTLYTLCISFIYTVISHTISIGDSKRGLRI